MAVILRCGNHFVYDWCGNGLFSPHGQAIWRNLPASATLQSNSQYRSLLRHFIYHYPAQIFQNCNKLPGPWYYHNCFCPDILTLVNFYFSFNSQRWLIPPRNINRKFGSVWPLLDSDSWIWNSWLYQPNSGLNHPTRQIYSSYPSGLCVDFHYLHCGLLLQLR